MFLTLKQPFLCFFYISKQQELLIFDKISETPMGLDGHEVAVVSTMGGALALVNRTLPKGWVRGFIHRQPVAAMSCFWAAVGLTLPLTVPRVRSALGLPTNQYNAESPNAVFPKYL